MIEETNMVPGKTIPTMTRISTMTQEATQATWGVVQATMNIKSSTNMRLIMNIVNTGPRPHQKRNV